MTVAPKHRNHEISRPSKLTGVLGLLFFLLAFVGQASHSHLPPRGQAGVAAHVLSKQADRPATSETADTAETCSLCVAMHSAAPANAHSVAWAAPVRTGVVFEHREVQRDEPVAFARLSRPPPTLSRAI